MDTELEHSSFVGRLISFAAILALSAFIFLPAASAQINGVPASVTSIGFGGNFDRAPGPPASVTSLGFGGQFGRTFGPPASVTSLGPNGLQGRQFFTTPDCCINPLFPSAANPPRLFHHRHHHDNNAFFPVGGAVYAVPYPVAVEPAADDSEDEEDYRGGPTIFDRRGSGQLARRPRQGYADRSRQDEEPREAAAAAEPVETPSDQPQTVLVFKDGHQAEIQNYAVVGQTLYDLSPSHYRKIALAELDLKATAKENDDRGISFQLPPGAQGN
jgi:hypothetical protein